MSLVDSATRMRAMTDLTSILLVEAAAGTGKTSLLAGYAGKRNRAGRGRGYYIHGRPPSELDRFPLL